MKRSFFLSILILLSSSLFAQSVSDLILSGPMVGYTDTREAMIWVQTNGPAIVVVRYHLAGDSLVYQTDPYTTRKSTAYTAHLLCNQVKPGKAYEYELMINGQSVERPYPTTFETPAAWWGEGFEEQPDLKFALGSCVYVDDEAYEKPGNKPYGAEFGIFETIRANNPQMMLWLGDNNYLRAGEWSTRMGIFHRYTHTRNNSEMQALLASTSNYAIWDDHDFGPNDQGKAFYGKDNALSAFRMFWANPGYGINRKPGITSYFSRGDASFYLLDNRYNRTANKLKGEQRTILGADQLDWLINALADDPHTWKFVCIGGQVLNDAAVWENYANIAPEEREYLIGAIAKNKVDNVVFLTGDRHHSELSTVEAEGVSIWDFTSSPLTAGTHEAKDEPNRNRVKGSHVAVRNFGLVEITGEKQARKAKLSLVNSKGKTLFSYELEAVYHD